MQTNKNYDNLEQSYLFSTIARKVREYSEAHPEADIIRLGIGDVTRPLVPAVIDALHAAVEDQAKQETFHGYGDEQGYGFLHEALVGYYKSHGVELATNEIFISDGAKSDLGNILDIFGTDNTCSIRITPSSFRIRFIRFMSTPTRWQAARSCIWMQMNPTASCRCRTSPFSATSSISALRTTRPALHMTAQV